MNRSAMMRSRMMASRVERYHAWPTLHRETVAEHTYGVLRIYCEIFGAPPPEVTQFIVDHDLPEILTGDLPFPVKKRYPQVAEALRGPEIDARVSLGCRHPVEELMIEDRDRWRVKVCDLLQMWQFGKVEKRMGSMFADAIVDDTAQAALDAAAQHLSHEDLQKVTTWMQEDEL